MKAGLGIFGYSPQVTITKPECMHLFDQSVADGFTLLSFLVVHRAVS
jgi:hypothetical protein